MDSQIHPNFDIDFEELISDEELLAQAERVENTQEKEQNKTKFRFAELGDNDLCNIVASAEAKGTKKNTRWAMKTVEGKKQMFTLLSTNI